MRSRKNAAIQCLLALIALTLLVLPEVTSAQDSDPALNPSVNIKFGESITFAIDIQSSAQPSRAVLFLRPSLNSQFTAHIGAIEAEEFSIVSIEFTPQSLNLLPFAQLEYYWQIDLNDGTIITTDPENVTYLDDRFPWQELTRNALTLHWVDGGIDWGQDLLAIAETALPDIESLIGVPNSSQKHIYIYPGKPELQNSLRQAGINQASAHTLPELGVVLLAGESDPETLIRFEQEIPHELVHLLLYERMGTRIDNLPIWLSEGLSTYFERSPRQLYSNALVQAHHNDALIEMASLCSSFPISENDLVLAYAQSESFTNYLLDVYGTGGVVRLLDAYQEGTTCTGGVQRVYQRSLAQLENEWRLVTFSEHAFLDRTMTPFYIAIAGVLIVAALILTVIIRKRS